MCLFCSIDSSVRPLDFRNCNFASLGAFCTFASCRNLVACWISVAWSSLASRVSVASVVGCARGSVSAATFDGSVVSS